MISAEQFAEWKAHPVTIEIYQGLNELVAEIKDQLANGNTIGGTPEETHGYTHRAVGQILGIEQILNITYGEEEPVEETSRY